MDVPSGSTESKKSPNPVATAGTVTGGIVTVGEGVATATAGTSSPFLKRKYPNNAASNRRGRSHFHHPLPAVAAAAAGATRSDAYAAAARGAAPESKPRSPARPA